jgi:hypothetical protein
VGAKTIFTSTILRKNLCASSSSSSSIIPKESIVLRRPLGTQEPSRVSQSLISYSSIDRHRSSWAEPKRGITPAQKKEMKQKVLSAAVAKGCHVM